MRDTWEMTMVFAGLMNIVIFIIMAVAAGVTAILHKYYLCALCSGFVLCNAFQVITGLIFNWYYENHK